VIAIELFNLARSDHVSVRTIYVIVLHSASPKAPAHPSAEMGSARLRRQSAPWFLVFMEEAFPACADCSADCRKIPAFMYMEIKIGSFRS
jgi:hypothetical protein